MCVFVNIRKGVLISSRPPSSPDISTSPHSSPLSTDFIVFLPYPSSHTTHLRIPPSWSAHLVSFVSQVDKQLRSTRDSLHFYPLTFVNFAQVSRKILLFFRQGCLWPSSGPGVLFPGSKHWKYYQDPTKNSTTWLDRRLQVLCRKKFFLSWIFCIFS